jgi:hypothetical protein
MFPKVQLRACTSMAKYAMFRIGRPPFYGVNVLGSEKHYTLRSSVFHITKGDFFQDRKFRKREENGKNPAIFK